MSAANGWRLPSNYLLTPSSGGPNSTPLLVPLLTPTQMPLLVPTSAVSQRSRRRPAHNNKSAAPSKSTASTQVAASSPVTPSQPSTTDPPKPAAKVSYSAIVGVKNQKKSTSLSSTKLVPNVAHSSSQPQQALSSLSPSLPSSSSSSSSSSSPSVSTVSSATQPGPMPTPTPLLATPALIPSSVPLLTATASNTALLVPHLASAPMPLLTRKLNDLSSGSSSAAATSSSSSSSSTSNVVSTALPNSFPLLWSANLSPSLDAVPTGNSSPLLWPQAPSSASSVSLFSSSLFSPSTLSSSTVSVSTSHSASPPRQRNHANRSTVGRRASHHRRTSGNPLATGADDSEDVRENVQQTDSAVLRPGPGPANADLKPKPAARGSVAPRGTASVASSSSTSPRKPQDRSLPLQSNLTPPPRQGGVPVSPQTRIDESDHGRQDSAEAEGPESQPDTTPDRRAQSMSLTSPSVSISASDNSYNNTPSRSPTFDDDDYYSDENFRQFSYDELVATDNAEAATHTHQKTSSPSPVPLHLSANAAHLQHLPSQDPTWQPRSRTSMTHSPPAVSQSRRLPSHSLPSQQITLPRPMAEVPRQGLDSKAGLSRAQNHGGAKPSSSTNQKSEASATSAKPPMNGMGKPSQFTAKDAPSSLQAADSYNEYSMSFANGAASAFYPPPYSQYGASPGVHGYPAFPPSVPTVYDYYRPMAPQPFVSSARKAEFSLSPSQASNPAVSTRKLHAVAGAAKAGSPPAVTAETSDNSTAPEDVGPPTGVPPFLNESSAPTMYPMPMGPVPLGFPPYAQPPFYPYDYQFPPYYPGVSNVPPMAQAPPSSSAGLRGPGVKPVVGVTSVAGAGAGAGAPKDSTARARPAGHHGQPGFPGFNRPDANLSAFIPPFSGESSVPQAFAQQPPFYDYQFDGSANADSSTAERDLRPSYGFGYGEVGVAPYPPSSAFAYPQQQTLPVPPTAIYPPTSGPTGRAMRSQSSRPQNSPWSSPMALLDAVLIHLGLYDSCKPIFQKEQIGDIMMLRLLNRSNFNNIIPDSASRTRLLHFLDYHLDDVLASTSFANATCSFCA